MGGIIKRSFVSVSHVIHAIRSAWCYFIGILRFRFRRSGELHGFRNPRRQVAKMIPFQSQLIVGAVTAIIAFGAGWKVNGWRYEATLNEIKAANAKVLQEATERAREREKALRIEADKAEVNYVAQRTRNAQLLADNRTLRLRDNAGSCPDLPGNPEAGIPTDKPAGCELSRSATDFLLTFAFQCDEAATYALACKQWADGLGK